MALKDILQSIHRESQKEIHAVKTEYAEKQAALEKQWKQKIQEKQDTLLSRAQKQAEDKLQQAKFYVVSQKNTEILKKKQEVIHRAYEEAVKQLAKLTPSEYTNLMKLLVENLPDTKGEIIAVDDTKKKALLKKAITNKKYTVAKETIEGSGGFVFRSAKIDIDNRFEALVENQKEATQTEVADVLFKK